MKFITPEEIDQCHKTLFVFGDNLKQIGRGGQAKVCRDKTNTAGVPTKKEPSMAASSFFEDWDLNRNKLYIDLAIKDLHLKLVSYDHLYIFPNIGKGLAMLDVKAPLTYKYLVSKLDELKNHSKYISIIIT